ncbi:MAG: alpha/beta hydrolase [Blautia sp.]|nr:alpha/beta hydrolase [Blautia sp.]
MQKEIFKEKSVFVTIDGQRMHVFRTGNKEAPKLVLLAGSGTVAPVYDFKVLYEKLTKDFRIIVIEKFGYGYSDLYEGPCDIDSVVSMEKQALEKAGEEGPYILAAHSMSGLEALRWKQLYPDSVRAIIGLDMAWPSSYMHWGQEEIDKRIRFMEKMRKLNDHGLLFWYPVSDRGLTKEEKKELLSLRKRNAMNPCYVKEARAVLENARMVDSQGIVDCPALLFVSDGKQVSAGWQEHQKNAAAQMKAKLVFLNCGHYIHYYESERISQEIRSFVKNLEG